MNTLVRIPVKGQQKAMDKLFSLGSLYVSDFLKPGQLPRHSPVELSLIMDNGIPRLEYIAPKDTMWGTYWYRSGINTTMRNELKSIVTSITDIMDFKENDLWIDIACNDGCLLSYVPKNLIRIGIDPSDDTFKMEAEKHANLIIQDYFSSEVFTLSKFSNLKAKVITCIAMFYDLEDPDTFLDDLYQILDDDGLVVFQLSYTPLMLKQLAFDNIVHEHVYYYSLFNFKSLIEKHGFQVTDCQFNDTNGGSFRVYVTKYGVDINSQALQDVCDYRIDSTLYYERTLGLEHPWTWMRFFERIEDLKDKTISFIKDQKSKGKTIMGYGSSTKGNTLLQYFGLDTSLITAIADRSTYKWGLRTVGTDIPIISEEEMRKASPDFLLILPWHFTREFRKREIDYLNKGGHFIIPCPHFTII